MDSHPDEDVAALCLAARRYLERHLPPSRLVADARSDEWTSADLWKQAVEMGWLGPLGEERGRRLEFLIGLEQEIARAGAAMPLLWVAGATLLPGSGAGTDPSRIAIVVDGAECLGGPAVTLRSTAGTHGLAGPRLSVPYGMVADRLVVLARRDSQVTVAAQVALDSVQLVSARSLDNEPVAMLDPSTVDITDVWDLTEDALQDWRTDMLILLSSRLVGTAAKTLDLSVNHVTTRHQFGRPIGSFQAVQHQLADVAITVDAAQLATWDAATRATRSDGYFAALVAAVLASRAAELATIVAAQVHGGVGHIDEHPLPTYFRRAKTSRLWVGGTDRLTAELGRVFLRTPGDGWWPDVAEQAA